MYENFGECSAVPVQLDGYENSRFLFSYFVLLSSADRLCCVVHFSFAEVFVLHVFFSDFRLGLLVGKFTKTAKQVLIGC